MDKPVDIRHVFFFIVFAVYGAFGSPTPDVIGPVEWFCALLLLASIPVQNLTMLFLQQNRLFWRCAAQFLLVYGLSVPLIMAFVSGHGVALVLRDVLPFLCLLLPLFFLRSDRVKTYWPVAAIVGVLFSLRVAAAHGADPLYLSISPCVVFAAILLMAYAGLELMEGVTASRLLRAIMLACLALLCFFALAATLQRASLVLSAAALLVLLLAALWRRPRRAVTPLLVFLLSLAVFYEPVADVFSALAQKQGEVGLNMRLQEASAVFDAITISPLHVLFGLGWGAQLESPAVGGMAVNYTHSLLTYIWLKTGLVGLLGLVLYLAAIAAGLLRALPKNSALVVALAVPLMIDTFLYASFKSLDFGLILLIAAATIPGEQNGAIVAPDADLVYR